MDQFTSDIDPFHTMQRHVIKVLRTKDAASYSELLPEGVSGNAFNYHFKQIVAAGLITQNSDKSYSLSDLGRLAEDAISSETFRFKLRPVLGVWLYITSEQHGTMLYRSNRQPMRHTVGLPFGKVALDVSMESAVERHLQKRGIALSDTTHSHVASANIRYHQDGALVSHRAGSIWHIAFEGDPITTATESGEAFWTNTPKDEPSILPEVLHTIDITDSWIEIDHTL